MLCKGIELVSVYDGEFLSKVGVEFLHVYFPGFPKTESFSDVLRLFYGKRRQEEAVIRDHV